MSWDWLWAVGRPKASAGRHVLFYTRRGCHLCDDAWEIVAAAQRRHGFTLEAWTWTPTRLWRRHGECVPVVTIDGKVRFRGRVNGVLLERMLRS